MAHRTYLFDQPDRFVVGTVGEPGNRTFFLQARRGSRIVSVSLEKVQVAALADRLGLLLVDLDERGVVSLGPDRPAEDAAPLDEPLSEAFRAGTLTLGWDGEHDRILIEARASGDDGDEGDLPEVDETSGETSGSAGIEELLLDDDPDGPDVMRVFLTPVTARAFAERAVRVMRSGRPPCPLCGNPLDAQGHICPRRNGQYVN